MGTLYQLGQRVISSRSAMGSTWTVYRLDMDFTSKKSGKMGWPLAIAHGFSIAVLFAGGSKWTKNHTNKACFSNFISTIAQPASTRDGSLEVHRSQSVVLSRQASISISATIWMRPPLDPDLVIPWLQSPIRNLAKEGWAEDLHIQRKMACHER